MNKMWDVVKSEGLKHEGKNIWVYEQNEAIFTGIKLIEIPKGGTLLEHKKIGLPKYAWYRHIGPYRHIPQAGLEMKNELISRGFKTSYPYIEIYGHWTSDENKSETELLMNIE